MKINGVIESVPFASTNTEPIQYTLTITSTGSMAECNHVMDLLMQDEPEPPEEDTPESTDLWVMYCGHCGKGMAIRANGDAYCPYCTPPEDGK